MWTRMRKVESDEHSRCQNFHPQGAQARNIRSPRVERCASAPNRHSDCKCSYNFLRQLYQLQSMCPFCPRGLSETLVASPTSCDRARAPPVCLLGLERPESAPEHEGVLDHELHGLHRRENLAVCNSLVCALKNSVKIKTCAILFDALCIVIKWRLTTLYILPCEGVCHTGPRAARSPPSREPRGSKLAGVRAEKFSED